MPKSYRFRTEIGTDREVRLNIEQDFDFLEILSLKLRQEDLYERFCADYGIVTGRVVANGGFGVQNATVSVFVPLDNVDENDTIISTLYPYKNLKDKNEDGYRYNLLPYKREYGGHTPTGTFPDREDVLTRKEVLQVYEKYYKYTVKTNSSGDFMIVGVPLGQQKLVMDLDLSNIGQFSLRPSDLIRMGMGVPSQFNGQQFKASQDLNSLPQIVNIVKEVDVTPFWGENDLCDVGITRSDFDLRDLGIEIQPQAIFMGSLFSTTDDDYLRANCKPKNDTGKLCDLSTGPGQIVCIRQTINVDYSGNPILEEYILEEGGNVIDDNGTWLIDLPMNLDYVTTNEFGEQILSIDPSIGIPTKAKSRFKIKWQNESGLNGDIIRANYLVPNIKEHGWSGPSPQYRPNEETWNKSYAFSLNWDDYYDKDAAINCEDSFYEFNFNKVYTVASHIDRFKWGFNRLKHLGIKEINNKACQSEINKPPVNDAQRNNNFFILLFNYFVTILSPVIITVIILAHVLAFIYPIIRLLLNLVIGLINGIIRTLCIIVSLFSKRLTLQDCISKGVTPLPKDNPFKNLSLPMISYPDCEACRCSSDSVVLEDNSDLEALASEVVMGPIADVTWNQSYEVSDSVCDNDEGEPTSMTPFTSRLTMSGYDNNKENKAYEKEIKLETGEGGQKDFIDWYKSPAYPIFKNGEEGDKTRWRSQPSPTLAQSLNLMNRRSMYFGDSGSPSPASDPGVTTTRMLAKTVNDQFGTYYHDGWTDSCFIMVLDPGSQVTPGTLFTFDDPNLIPDPNTNKYPNGNEFFNNGLTGNTINHQENGYTNIDITYVDYNGTSQTASAVPIVNTGATTSYKFKSGVEYFQVLTAMTKSVVASKVDVYSAGLLKSHFLNYKTAFRCRQQDEDPGPTYPWSDDGCGTHCKRIPANHYLDDDDLVVVFAVRGVDPYTPRQKMRYDLSKIFGHDNGVSQKATWNGQVVVEGEYYLNIPIQPNVSDSSASWANGVWRNGERTPTPHYQWYANGLKFHDSNNSGDAYNGNANFDAKALYHPSYTADFSASGYELFYTESFNKYVSLDSQLVSDDGFDIYMGDSGGGINCPGDDYPEKGINPWFQRNIEGCGYQYSRVSAEDRKLNAKQDVITVSPLYIPTDIENDALPNTEMNNSTNIVFRSDRLPSSAQFDSNPEADNEGYRRYALHLNLRQQIFFIADDASITTIEGDEVGSTDVSGNAADASEDANSITTNIIKSFGCEGMVPLNCYEGEGEEFEVVNPCDLPGPIESDERVINGCYRFVIKKLIATIPRDVQMFFEWRVRIRFMFSLCQGIIGQMFQNNWLNGSLYMPSFQKQTLYNSDNQPKRYRHCGDPQQFWVNQRYQGPLYFNTETNSFFYRSTPFNDNTNQFIGQEPSRDYYFGQNDKNIWYPTTINELGPRDEFTKEIAFSPEFQGYIVDTISTTSYNDPSNIDILFIVSRLANAGFLEQLLGAGDGSIGQLFSRESQILGFSNPLDSRADGDYAQMIGINSEYGVLPFFTGNYEDSTTISDDRFGIWFSSNTINRRVITNGVTTFGTEPTGPSDTFGYSNTQTVPYYMWKVNDNGLFGTQENSWDTEYIFNSKYQGDDFYDNNSTYMKPNSGYGLGYIYNRSSTDPEYDSYPTNDVNGGNFKVGAPFYYYFGLKRGKSAMNRYIKKYIFAQDE